MQDLGLVRAYMQDQAVNDFVKSLAALPFLPINRLGDTLLM